MLGVGRLYLCIVIIDEGAALPGKPAMMYIYKVYVRRACDDQIVLLTNQIEVIDHD